MKSIDLNCDVGEGMNNEAELMPFLSSCNIACGVHAGDDKTIEEVVQLAINHDVAIGAHPSFDDRANFGRTEMNISSDQLSELIQDQVLKLKTKTEALGGKLRYVKPHGALYNMAARSAEISEVIINGLLEIDSSLCLMGLSGSAMQHTSVGKIGFIAEGFADRKYATAYSLKARKYGGLITDFEMISTQLKFLLESGQIQTDEGMKPLNVQSLCLHGDTPYAVMLVARIHELILSMGYKIEAP
jgi:UPF0271 protein